MRLRRLYYAALTEKKSTYLLTSDQSSFHYLVHVLRIKQGQPIELFNGQGFVGQGQINEVSKKELSINIVQFIRHLPTPLQLHLMLSLSKGDRMDYALQKSTELGVTHITPILTARGEVKLKDERLEKKHSHWQGVITSACEQSYQNFMPTLYKPKKLTDLTLAPSTPEHLAFFGDINGDSIKSYQNFQPKSFTFFVGPEGGWALQECEFFKQNNIQPVKLGPRILRAETAPIALLALAQYLWGDF